METNRKDEKTRELAPVWDPSRAVRDFFRWDPFSGEAPFRSLVERGAMSFQPSFDVRETKESYLIKADVPGMKEEDVHLHLVGNRLQVSGKREAEKEERTDTVYTRERTFGSFMRTFTLPEDADGEKVKAELKDGVLCVTLQKKANAQSKRIPVSTK